MKDRIEGCLSMECAIRRACTGSAVCPRDPDDEPTTEFVLAERCPSCRSLDTEPFHTHVDGTKHCIPCGRIFK